MTEHADQLREAFETHENQAPDPAAVYARVQELSTKYKRRRRGLQVAGGTALAAIAVAGVVTLPNLLPGNARNTSSVSFPAGAVPSSAAPVTIPKFTQAELEKYWKAYFGANYGYDDAVKLAALWNVKADIGNVKAEAGRRLLAGETLPFKGTPNPIIPPADPDDPAIKAAQAQLDAFFGAGYTWTEAEKLAKIWHLQDPSDAKIMAGKKLLAHQTLPVKPTAANVQAAKEQKQVEAFFKKGYDIADAAKLAKTWHLKTAYDAKVAGGKRILAGQSMPFQP
ncbi:hypothetical protein ACQPZX_21075 [Actinoplanes sp. CA-142083]|uniref:hypothetical protein n=1 Tax=Actinoplanes sp. CA-142083 TaxID=3239903 RepID=UPI003D9383C2